MLTRLFRSRSNIQFILVLIGALLLWLDGFYHKPLPIQGDQLSPLYNLLFSWSYSNGPAATLIAFSLVLGTAILLNYILSMDGVLPRNSFMPAMVTMLLFSYAPALLKLHPVLPANLLLITAVHLMLRSGPREKPYQELLTAGILLSLSTMFNFPHFVYIPLVWITLLIFRSLSLRDWTISTLGILTPFIYLAFYYFWTGELRIQWDNYSDFFRNFRFFAALQNQTFMILLITGLITIFFLPAFMRFAGRLTEKLIALRKSSLVIIWLFMLGVFSLAILQRDLLINGAVLLLPISTFISAYILSVKKTYFTELMLWLILAAIVTGKFIMPF